MLVNLMPPAVDVGGIVLREPEIVVVPAEPARGFLVVHPRYRSWVAKCGIASAKDALDLPGEIVSGHPNRHVLQVQMKSGTGTRNLYLKREHAVGWRVRIKNWLDGFGRVSRSEREAKVLEKLEAAGLPGPHWIACGEDGDGRAFLLVDELTGYRELRTVLADTALSVGDRATLATRLGESLAELHDAGFDTPDLAAKHVFVRPGSFSTTVLDWQSSKPGVVPDTVARLESLASLNASLVEWLATPRERLRVVKAYLGKMKQVKLEFAAFARTVFTQSRKRLKRSSIRVQRQPNAIRHDQRLVWLAGETVCAIPEIAKLWPKPVIAEPFYLDPKAAVEDGERLGIRLADNWPATLVRFRTSDPLGRIWSELRGKSWRSPASRMARVLFHLQNAGVDVPQLYAFGQRLEGAVAVDSFLVHGLPEGTPTLGAWLAKNEAERELEQLGGILRSVHDAGCILGPSPNSICVIATRGKPRIVIDPTHAGQLLRDVSESRRIRDLIGILKSLPLSADDRLSVLGGYGDPRIAKSVRKRVAAA